VFVCTSRSSSKTTRLYHVLHTASTFISYITHPGKRKGRRNRARGCDYNTYYTRVRKIHNTYIYIKCILWQSLCYVDGTCASHLLQCIYILLCSARPRKQLPLTGRCGFETRRIREREKKTDDDRRTEALWPFARWYIHAHVYALDDALGACVCARIGRAAAVVFAEGLDTRARDLCSSGLYVGGRFLRDRYHRRCSRHDRRLLSRSRRRLLYNM